MPEQQEKPAFSPSPHQEAVRDAWLKNREHLVVDAVAGSGKTTTILWVLSSTHDEISAQLGRRPQVLLSCFNRSIKDELSKRVDPRIATPMTLNGLGHRILLRWSRDRNAPLSLDSGKLRSVLRQVMPSLPKHMNLDLDRCSYQDLEAARGRVCFGGPFSADPEQDLRVRLEANGLMSQTVLEVADLARATLSDDYDWIVERYGLDDSWDLIPKEKGPYYEQAVELCPRIWKECVDAVLARCKQEALENGVIDYTDQVWLPAVLKLPSPVYDSVFVDEAQDLNMAQLLMLSKCVSRGGRLVFVGDPYQAIYAFRGAGHGMIGTIENLLSASSRGVKTLPLHYCYRCPTSVLDLVRSAGRVTHIQAPPGAPKGAVKAVMETSDWRSKIDLYKTNMILCRTNAPLVLCYISLIQEGIKASIRGRGDGGVYKQIVKLIEKSGGGSCNLAKLVQNARESSKKRIEVLWADRKFSQAVYVGDVYQCLSALAETCETVQELSAAIEKVFAEDGEVGDGVVLSSVHKAKGLEAQDVYVLRPDLLPLLALARTQEGIEQEENLAYVCYTRAQETLTFIRPPSVQQRSVELRELFPGIKIEAAERPRPMF